MASVGEELGTASVQMHVERAVRMMVALQENVLEKEE